MKFAPFMELLEKESTSKLHNVVGHKSESHRLQYAVCFSFQNKSDSFSLHFVETSLTGVSIE